MDQPDLAVVCEVLRDLQRDHREEPFFAELFAVRGPGFLAASSAVSVDRLTPVSIEHITAAWDGLTALLGVPSCSRSRTSSSSSTSRPPTTADPGRTTARAPGWPVPAQCRGCVRR